MRKKPWIAVLLLLVLGLSFSTVPVNASNYNLDVKTSTVNMVVDENGLVTVDQILDINFNTNLHGIYAFVPQSYNMTWTIDGEKIDRSYFYPVRNIKVYNDPYKTETDNNNNIFIKIGDANSTIIGPKTYHYSYTIQMRDLNLNGLQSFYMNIVGADWQMPIEKVNFTITLPKDWPKDIYFYSDAYGNNDAANVTYTVSGKTLTGVYNSVINPGSALTIKSDLPNDFFTFIPAPDYSTAGIVLLAILAALIYFAFLKIGKDEHAVESVQFNPIPGLSSAQVGYIYDGAVDTRDVVSLIIEWASKGYLTITEDAKVKNAFTLSKIKDIDGTEITAEKTLFNSLFKGRDEVTNKQLETTFYTSVAGAKADITRFFQGNPKRNIFRKDSTAYKVLFGILVMIPVGLTVGSLVYRSTYMIEYGLLAGAFTAGFGSLVTLIWVLTVKRWPSMSAAARFGMGLLSLIVSLILAAAMFLIFFFNEGEMWKLAIMIILTAFNIGVVSVMDKRTSQGVEYLGKILGLKTFITLAEKDKLEMLVAQDPEYFYKVLPYAYVLNVSDVWSKKFESIAMPAPSWYVGPNYMNSYLFMHTLNHTMSHLSTAMTSAPVKSGSGGGSFGGGGGGGFSGGGFGGGGGGGW